MTECKVLESCIYGAQNGCNYMIMTGRFRVAKNLREKSRTGPAENIRRRRVRERNLERKIVEAVRSQGGVCLKWTSPGFTGVPDRIVFLPGGRIGFVEVKRPDGKGRESERQKRVAQILTLLGQKVRTVSSMKEFEEFINEL